MHVDIGEGIVPVSYVDRQYCMLTLERAVYQRVMLTDYVVHVDIGEGSVPASYVD